MTFNPEHGGEEQFDLSEDRLAIIGPAKWTMLAEEGGGMEHIKNRGPEARKGITREGREIAEREPRFARVLEATGGLAEAAARERLRK